MGKETRRGFLKRGPQRTFALVAGIAAMTTGVGLGLLEPKRAYADTIPGDAVWRFSDDFYQAWARDIETDGSSGTHWNFMIQRLNGGLDFSDFHITSEGLQTLEDGSQQWVWGVNDSIRRVCGQISESGGLDAQTAAENAIFQFVEMVSQVSGEVAGGILNDASELVNLFANILGYLPSVSCAVA